MKIAVHLGYFGNSTLPLLLIVKDGEIDPYFEDDEEFRFQYTSRYSSATVTLLIFVAMCNVDFSNFAEVALSYFE